MAPKTKKDGLTDAVAEAESAVASVKDPELRRAAFEKVLQHLLENQGGPTRTSRSSAARAPAKGAAKSSTKAGPTGRIADLIDDGFFTKPRSIAEVKAELANRGHHIALTALSTPLQRLCKSKRLRRQKGTAASGGSYGYTNW
jgi:hypothetical protein